MNIGYESKKKEKAHLFPEDTLVAVEVLAPPKSLNIAR
jgi:hypothetical protein